MSLGGFAQGLATAFSKAEDRYQDKKAREEARADAKLARAAQNAFTEKLYDRRERDAYRKELRDTYGYLQATFGTDEEGRRLSAAFLPMGASAKDVIKQYQASVKGTGIDFKSLINVSNPSGATDEYKVPKFDAIMTQLVDARYAKDGQETSGFMLPTVKLGKIPDQKEEITGLTGLGSDDAFEAMLNIDLARSETQANISYGASVEKNKAKLEVLNKLYEQEKKKAEKQIGTGIGDVPASMYNMVDRKNREFIISQLGGSVEVVDAAQQTYKLKRDGNRVNILLGFENGYRNKDDLFSTFMGSRVLSNAQVDTYNANYVGQQNNFLQETIRMQVSKQTRKSNAKLPIVYMSGFKGMDQTQAKQLRQQQERELAKLKPGMAFTPMIIDESGEYVRADAQLFKKKTRVTENNPSGILAFLPLQRVNYFQR